MLLLCSRHLFDVLFDIGEHRMLRILALFAISGEVSRVSAYDTNH